MKDLKELRPRSIVVRMPNWIGDLVMATPILIDLRKAFPQAKITAMCQKNVAPLLKHELAIDELLQFERRKGLFGRLKQTGEISSLLKQGQYELGILLTHSFSSAWHFFMGKVKERIGYQKEGRHILLTHPLPFLKKQTKHHLTMSYKKLLIPLGIPPSLTAPQLVVTTKEKEKVWNILKKLNLPLNPTLIGISPGAAFGPAKCWLPDRFGKVAQDLVKIDPNHVILFFGDCLNRRLSEKICPRFSKRILNFAGKTTLREFVAFIAICSAFLTNDSGPMHIADSLGTPLVALFGSTSPLLTGPFHQMEHVIQKKTECSPCFKRTCPIGLPCMKNIQTEEVVQAVLKQLMGKPDVLA